MNATNTKTVSAVGIISVFIVGSLMFGKSNQARADELEKTQQAAKINTAVDQIQKANAGLPDLQVQAKTLIFTAMIQKKIPLTAKWCETLNVDGKLWATTPTNTLFALNSAVAGLAYSKTNRMAGDVVVFFETSSPGWNRAGGAELLAAGPGSVAVALADGRAMTVTPTEAAKLRWNP